MDLLYKHQTKHIESLFISTIYAVFCLTPAVSPDTFDKYKHNTGEAWINRKDPGPVFTRSQLTLTTPSPADCSMAF